MFNPGDESKTRISSMSRYLAGNDNEQNAVNREEEPTTYKKEEKAKKNEKGKSNFETKATIETKSSYQN